ncbi:MAG: tetratricopeptide repeat protein [Bacteroidota bacterium]
MFRFLFLILCLFLFVFQTIGQNKYIDSLKTELGKNIHDTAKIWICENIALGFKGSQSDSSLTWLYKGLEINKKAGISEILKAKFTAYLYFDIGSIYSRKKEYDLAIDYNLEALKNFKKIGRFDEVANCYINCGFCEMNKENLDNASGYFNKVIEIYNNINDSVGMSVVLINLGSIYLMKGEYNEALTVFQKSLKIKEKLKDNKGVANVLMNIGSTHKAFDNYKQALDYYYIALEKYVSLGDLNGQAKCYNNLALTYRSLNNLDASVQNYNNAVECYKKSGNEKGLNDILINLGNTYYSQKKYDDAYECYQKHLENSLKNNEEISVAKAHNNIGAVEKERKNYKNAIFHLDESFKIFEKNDLLPGQISSCFSLAEVYDEMGDYKTSIDKYKKFKKLQDSLFVIEKEKEATELEARYQNEKKAQQIELQNIQLLQNKTEMERQAEVSQRQKFQRNASFIGLFLVLIVGLLIFLGYRQKKKSNELLIKQNHEIQKQSHELRELNEELTQKNEEISAQRDEIEAQRNTVTDQKHEIENIYNELMDSIKYALRIQNAVLPSENYFNILFDKYFVFFKPLEIVSGDFYWATQIDQYTLFCVADCTGHGVPGAFMSMLGISILNEIVRKKEVTNAAEVLNELRKNIIHSLNQKGISEDLAIFEKDSSVQIKNESHISSVSVKDGMDMAFCIYNKDTNVLEYAGAYNPCCIIQLNSETGEKELIELKPEKMPIGLHYKTDAFTNKTIRLQKDSIIYLFSDGFPDQFGGKDEKSLKTGGRKYLIKNFKELLLSVSEEPMNEQKAILEKTFIDWRGDFKQTDDVTVVGLEF